MLLQIITYYSNDIMHIYLMLQIEMLNFKLIHCVCDIKTNIFHFRQ
jgi:hypothetical protein